MYEKLKIKALVVMVIVVLLFSGSSIVPAKAQEPEKQSELEFKMEYLGRIIKFVEQNYVDEIEEEKLVEGAYKGIFDALDIHSTYYTPEEYHDFETSTSGVFGGTGVHITMRDQEVYVISAIEGTPADRAGIKAGDIIVSVDDTDIKGYSLEKVADMIRGDIGTRVKLGVKREGEKDILYFDLVREEIKVSPVSSRVLEEGVGYLRISSFNGNTEENVQKALKEFDEQGVKGIIVDLRNNPGGLLDEVEKVAQHFVPQGPIVHIQKRNGERTTYTSDLREQKYRLVVLVDGGSASASEIFAGAVQDTKVGTIVGTQTFGKGTVQSIIPLTNGGAMKLTIAKYLTPNGRVIDGEGIIPDVVVDNLSWAEKLSDELAPIKGDRKPSVGIVGLDVLGAEQRLNALGYQVGEVDGIFDQALEKAVASFQADSGLYPYGVLDFTTQKRLQEKFVELMEQEEVDEQLQKAIEILKEKL